ncbi:YcxB family protein [Moraxella bovis]|uniref:YcxB family protein n=1 Tax=Moraxella bovis TaxID=476 RepID=A0A1T0A6E3_MORBO|nr:YcxB family protein [Moraxella bovis]AWY20797.1 YcxB family protein [Moraxella bovis]OOR91257.1 hypothetical protein B0182_03355 [Moraxella bovis]UYZ76525.1 YcxB family protein [Moraxella bovis]UYZ77523.1 YcxB family protein [Moraxella bovis]UYZ81976.1 YcxB family protein [Moraxella bovis]
MSKQKALYPYTIQPVALNMTESEFKSAQLALFNKSSQSFGLKSVRTKEWLVLGVLAVASILGIIFVSGYSTILFWLTLGLCIGYLIARTKGLQWYAKREFDKQLNEIKLPPELNQMKLGVQPQGLVMSMPMAGEQLEQIQSVSKKRGHTTQGFTMKSSPMQQAIIPWTAVTSWDETDEFIFAMFEYQGQKGSQIIPKRLKNNHLPIDTIIKHLGKVTPKGLKMENVA